MRYYLKKRQKLCQSYNKKKKNLRQFKEIDSHIYLHIFPTKLIQFHRFIKYLYDNDASKNDSRYFT